MTLDDLFYLLFAVVLGSLIVFICRPPLDDTDKKIYNEK